MEHLLNKIHCAECLAFMRQLPDKCADLVLTDPPYFRIVSNEWDRQWASLAEFQKWVGEVADELRRVLKDSGSLYWFCDDKVAAYCQLELDKRFALLNSLVWRKTNPLSQKAKMGLRSYAICTERCLFYEQKSAAGLPATGLEQIHSTPDCFASIKAYMREQRALIKEARGFKTEKEFCAYIDAITGTRSVASHHYFADSQYMFPTAEMYARLQTSGFFRREYEDLRREYEDLRRVWNASARADEVLEYPLASQPYIHPTQKPLPLMAFLMERSSRGGDVVLDPFSGSGTTCLAAQMLGRKYIGIECDAEYHAASVARLEKERMQGRLELFTEPKAVQGELFGK